MTTGKKTVLLTGATGFLGSHLMVTLLQKGYLLRVLGRSGKVRPLPERVSNLLHWFGAGQYADQVNAFEVDFEKTELGLGRKDYARLCAGEPMVIHCAADTGFAEQNRQRVMAANVNALAGILELLKKSRASFFHHFSTVFAAGAVAGSVPESAVQADRFHNVYEESKAIAESLVSGVCREFSIPYTIIRPAIVYGDSRSGRSLKFNALYSPVKSMQLIKDIYLHDLQQNGGARSAPYGIFIAADGCLHLPIRIFLPRAGSINLIPVDYFAAAALAIIENPAAGKIYHISSAAPSSMETLAGYTERFLALKGLRVVYQSRDKNPMFNPAEELFDHFLRPYYPYLSDQRSFEKTNTDRTTGAITAPELSYEIFARCMNYARSVEWGKSFRDF
ncbi:MAG TPA: SDR family oxidoreductase [Candidatus Binatia bacterium]|nr:SDR family oxidoreductase [Candidatus Binatia bacterium]